MKKIIGFASIVLTSLVLLFVITSCANSTNNNGNQELSNVTSTNPNEPSQTEPSNPDTSDNPGTDENVYYTITFKDYDGTVLQTSNFKKGETPTYNKTNPSRNNDDNYSYTFNGWNPSIETVSKDMVYTATYISTKNSYTVTWKNCDGEILETDTNVEYGTMPEFNSTLSIPKDVSDFISPIEDHYNINMNVVFKSWDKEIKPVTDDVTYTATYESLTVLWLLNKKDECLYFADIVDGIMPEYNGETPELECDEKNYYYEFDEFKYHVFNQNGLYVYYYDAYFKLLECKNTITFNLEGGYSTTGEALSIKVNDIKDIEVPVHIKKKKYELKGYEYNGVKVYDENGNKVSDFELKENMTFNAIYEESIELTIYYTVSGNTYTELFEELGDISKTSTYKFNTYVDLHAYPNEGYTFIGWYNNGYVLSNEKDYKYMMWDEDFTIEARFEYTSYKLNVWSNNYDLGQVMIREGYSQTFYNEETLNEYYTQSVTIAAYTKSDIRFLGWYNELNQLVSTKAVYQFNMPNKNYKLEAKWNYFNITYDLDEGINNENNPTFYDVDMENITLLDPTKDGYTFIGFEYNGNVITEIETSNICHMELKALWTYYTLTTDLNNSKAGTIISYDNVKVTKGNTITLVATTNPGYTFDGWYDGDNQVSPLETYTFNMPANNLSYIAKWTANTNTTYKVEHYLQNLDDDNYPELPYETDNLTGTTDTLTNGEVNTYEGFTSPTITQVNINGNGSTIIKLYYTRNSYDLSLNTSVNDGPKVEDLIGFSNITSFYTSNSYFEIGSLAIQKIFNSGVGVSGINYLGETKTYTYANVTSAGSYDDSRYIKITIPFDGVRLYVAFVIASSNESRAMYLSETRNTTFTDAIAGVYASNVDMAYIDVELGAGVYYLNYTASVRIYEMYLVTCKAGTITDSGIYKYGKEITIKAETNPGYTFNGWFNEDTLVSPLETYTFTMLAENLVYTAKWTANTNTIYKVEHYLQNLDDDNYPELPYETDNLTGTTDTKTNGFVKTYGGFTSPTITQVNINGNGQTVIVLNYTRNSYAVELSKSIDKAGTITGAGTYKYGKEVTITALTNEGYTFKGWYDGDNEISTSPSYTFNMPSKNLSYTAKWTANINTSYKVEHYQQNINDNNYPSTPYETDNLTGTTDTLTKGEVNTYEGFTSPTITQVNINGDGTTVIKLYYTRNSYTITLKLNNDKVGTTTGAGTYKYGKEITIKAPTNPGYTFNGWYMNNEEYTTDSSFDYEIGLSNVTFEARYTINKYTITLDNQASGVTISGITSGNSYDYNNEITLTAVNNSGLFLVWTVNGNIEHIGNDYSFNVPANDVNITTTTSICPRDGNKIYFGTYPQTKVTDNTLISELNTLAGTKPTSSKKYNWTDYNYYIESSITSYMYYQDIDYDNNGTYDYRGVYFTQYRPYRYYHSSSISYSNQNYNGYTTNTIYWFSYDPIEWDILTESSGKSLIIANLILDSQDYYPKLTTSSFSHNGGTGYANNYELSNIRKFLNDNFYNTAFNDLQKALIEITEVDNSVASTGQWSNSNACNNTNDKMFLLSYMEAITYYSSDARTAQGTDYAKCQGLYVYTSPGPYQGNGCWWLRSPSDNDANAASNAYNVNRDGYISYIDVCYTYYGVRPACWITL